MLFFSCCRSKKYEKYTIPVLAVEVNLEEKINEKNVWKITFLLDQKHTFFSSDEQVIKELREKLKALIYEIETKGDSHPSYDPLCSFLKGTANQPKLASAFAKKIDNTYLLGRPGTVDNYKALSSLSSLPPPSPPPPASPPPREGSSASPIASV